MKRMIYLALIMPLAFSSGVTRTQDLSQAYLLTRTSDTEQKRKNEKPPERVEECEIKIEEPCSPFTSYIKPALFFTAGVSIIVFLHWRKWITLPRA